MRDFHGNEPRDSEAARLAALEAWAVISERATKLVQFRTWIAVTQLITMYGWADDEFWVKQVAGMAFHADESEECTASQVDEVGKALKAFHDWGAIGYDHSIGRRPRRIIICPERRAGDTSLSDGKAGQPGAKGVPGGLKGRAGDTTLRGRSRGRTSSRPLPGAPRAPASAGGADDDGGADDHAERQEAARHDRIVARLQRATHAQGWVLANLTEWWLSIEWHPGSTQGERLLDRAERSEWTADELAEELRHNRANHRAKALPPWPPITAMELEAMEPRNQRIHDENVRQDAERARRLAAKDAPSTTDVIP